jgi:hypothetical protein
MFMTSCFFEPVSLKTNGREGIKFVANWPSFEEYLTTLQPIFFYEKFFAIEYDALKDFDY